MNDATSRKIALLNKRYATMSRLSDALAEAYRTCDADASAEEVKRCQRVFDLAAAQCSLARKSIDCALKFDYLTGEYFPATTSICGNKKEVFRLIVRKTESAILEIAADDYAEAEKKAKSLAGKKSFNFTESELAVNDVSLPVPD